MGSKEQKRSRGDGTVYQRGKTWYGEWTAGWDGETGKRIKMRFKGPTKRDVSSQIAKAKTEYNAGNLVPDSNATLADFVAFWLPIAKQQLRQTSYENRLTTINAHILPTFGKAKLSKIAKIQVQQWVNQLSVTRKPHTVHDIYNALRRILGDAVDMGLLVRNPAKGVILPQIGDQVPNVLTAEQGVQLLRTARGDDLEALYVLGLTAAMREGELLGLKWSDIDWKHQRLQVCRSLAQIKGGLTENDPKTRTSRRSVPLTSLALEALKRRRVIQNERRLAKGPSWEESDYIFTNTYGRPLRCAHLLTDQYYPMLERAGLPKIRFHDLRHTTASILFAMNIPAKVVQELLGHASIKMTIDLYTHLMPTMAREAVNQLDALFREMTAE